jgi:uncharacterized protein
VARGLLEKPQWHDPVVEALRERGAEHERNFVETLRAQGLRVVEVRDSETPAVATRAAMAEGVDVLVQAELEANGWRGYADVLRRVETPSALGAWSYEAYDTKLARETRGGTILQLAVYSELLRHVQGAAPAYFHVVTPDPVQPLHSFRFGEFAAYYRLMRDSLLRTLELGPQRICEANYPEPGEYCELCRWWPQCNGQRRRDDHLSFIAGIGRLHRKELESHGVRTLAAVAALPIPFTPSRGSRDTYVRFREQARVQNEQRTMGKPVYELLQLESDRGLTWLPAPSPGDLFLDLEGAPFAREGGREYLFGLWSSVYEDWWAFSDGDERVGFEAVVDRIMRACDTDPGMHVYHFGHYEETAFKRLMGRHATRAEELDRLLRSDRFVDLHTIVRGALRAGVESYSIKELEQYYNFAREVPLRDASGHRLTIELALESEAGTVIPDEVRHAVRGYNRDDCRSAQALRDWLEHLRSDLEANGTGMPRPEAKPGDPSEKVNALDQEAEAIRQKLLAELPSEASDPEHPRHPVWLLAYLVDWHRREAKAQWWDYFRVRELSEEDLLDEPKALTGLELLERVEMVRHKKTGRPTGSVVDRYRYPSQEIDFGRNTRLRLHDGSSFGEVLARDTAARTIDVKKGPSRADFHPSDVFATDVVPTDRVQRAVMSLAESPDEISCGTDVLFRRAPRLTAGSLQQAPGESDADFGIRVVSHLDDGALSVQGPPGSGKTYVGARVIRALATAGKRVGVTAVSHKVIRNLLDEVRRQAAEANERIRLAHKVSEVGDNGSGVREITDNEVALEALRTGEAQVLGGTAWLWSDEHAAGIADVLFVDEAGQMSLANVLAVSLAARSLVLLGDPQQLEQPQKGTHPDGVSVSALEHVLGGEKTMRPERGMFLAKTWRLAPAVCEFTSEMFYEDKLHPRDGLEHQRLEGTHGFDGAGLWWVPVQHEGNQNWSGEEVEAVARVIERLLTPGASWVDARGISHALTDADVLVVAPYNAQVNRLSERLAGRGIRVGTVDKFQGQQAPVVIYSMATSRPEDAPRGMEFLYSLNRLNVATSRARCAAILVASPALFEPECRTPRQMQLANALCRFKELATVVSVEV